LDRKEYDGLLHLIDQMIETSEPKRAEYFRGYRRGIQFHVLGNLEETAQEHYRLYNSPGRDSGDHYVNAFARGYRDGCKGRTPEDN
jgi:ribosome modulation factor